MCLQLHVPMFFIKALYNNPTATTDITRQENMQMICRALKVNMGYVLLYCLIDSMSKKEKKYTI